MAKIQLFKVKINIDEKRNYTIDHKGKELVVDHIPEEFDETKIAKKAQEVATFNHEEVSVVKSFGKGDYTIEFKLIVQ